ncbi:dihydrofolate reductase [Piscinibacter koreensis]|uniref:Dihydrofolate reductase n=1 Tax=Piscinibacter koreensis TaxID=2742824 RepID=A0A7Y6NRU9_9BURK|nr:dihydrofolate reductase [Schlegelella koreensis]NUZ08174.1 dihydrofolate reductase [Schlegelella koreensis]
MDRRAPSRPLVSLVAAVARDGGIGRDNGLLVHLPEDLKHFKRTTLGAPIVMGRRTWDAIGRPLPGRRNIVITRDPKWHADGAERAASLDAAVTLAAPAPKVYVIGGAQIYALALPDADELVLTELDAEFDADTWFPAWPREAFLQQPGESHVAPQGFTYRFVTYSRKRAQDSHTTMETR